jgi:DNA polymerase-3 subunit alpha
MSDLPILYPCHLHSWFSLGDSCISPKNLVKRMQELNIDKTAVTDHGNVLHVIRFNTALKNDNKTLYPGEEFYFCEDASIKDKDHRSSYHLTIVAYNQEGLSNLYSLSSMSYIDGYYFKPKIDMSMLRQHYKGLRVSSACIKGMIANEIINDNYENAKKVAQEFKDLLGDNFYLEIMPHNLDEQRKANLGILKISEELNIPLLATYDAHMCWQSEVKYRRFLIQMTKAGWADDDPELGMTDTIYMMSAEEYVEFFKKYHPDFPIDKVIEAIANTEKYLGNEKIEMETDQCIFPKIDIPPQYKDDLDYIKHLLWNSMKQKGLDKKPEYIERVKEELEIMNNDGFVPYFLVLYDVFNWCRQNNVMTGPGRGSGAGSLMNYLLGITRIDPLKFELRFDRFYNAGRKGPDGCPDVDSDFADARREEVIKYTEQKYGSDKISQICNISTMKMKSCIKDCARVLKIPFAEANALTNKIDWESFESLEEAKEDKVAGAWINKYKEVFDYVEYFLDFPRQTGKHAAGIIISNRPIGDVCPMMISEVEGKKFLISQFDKDDVHKTGLIKFDYLGLSTLTFLTHILEDIKKTTGKTIDLDSIDIKDPNIYEHILATADTDNVFQMESGGMRNYLKRLHPDRFGDLSALNSLYRPAGIKSGAIDNYINNKYNQPKKYGIQELDDLLAKTNYVVCYDEIKMDIVGKFGDFSPKDINKFRKSSGKKDPKSMEYCQEMKPVFVENAQKHGLSESAASQLYDSLIGYAFCKAHADCYSILTYWTAWLKYYYPINFLHASFTFSTMDIEKDKYSVKTAIKMAKRMGYSFVGVDINKSCANFSFDDEKRIVYWSMRNIKQISEDISTKIENNKPYVDFNDFVTRGKEFGVSKRVIDPLVTLGAFDSLNCEDQIKEWYIKNNKLKKADREALGIETKEQEIEYITNQYQEMVNKPKSDKENEYLGMVVSVGENNFTYNKKCINFAQFKRLKDKDNCVICGILTKKELKKGKSGGNYAVYTIMDPDYNFYTVQLSGKTHEKLESANIAPEYKTKEGQWVMLYGSKCDESRMFLNDTQIVDLETYERRVKNHEIKEKMVFQG